MSSERRLLAVMFTDIVGYTALTERGEALALRVRDRHRALLGTLVEQFKGTLVEAPGDEALASFPSALLAVDCALALQAVLRDDEELALRIGIHMGDVVQRDGELIGEGVNLAARIRPLAEPGGICVSGQVHELVRSQPHVAARALGAHSLKNVSDPVQVWAIAPTQTARRRRGGRYALAAGVIALVAIAAYVPNRTAVAAWIALNAPKLFASEIEQEIGFATTSDGVRIAYGSSGEGPPVVMVLGWLSHLERGIGSQLYDNGGLIQTYSRQHRFVRYDGRGFGLSDRDVSDFALEARVRDLEAVVDAAGLERFALLGVSAGGPAAVTYAARHPGRVTRIALIGTYARSAGISPERDAQIAGMVSMISAGWTPLARAMMVEFLNPNADDVGRRVVGELLAVAADGPAVAGFLQAANATDASEAARSLHLPALVVHGAQDTTVPLSAGRDLAALIPGARFEVVSDVGHAVALFGVSDLVTEFFARDLDAPGAG